MFDSVFGKKYDVKGEIATLYEELRSISDLKTLSEHPGWHRLAKWIVGRIVILATEINDLASNAEKNVKEIQKRNWSIQVYKSLIHCVGTTLDEEKSIIEKLKQLEEVARVSETRRG